MTTQIATDTELSAVNSILGSIGQSPITTLDFNNPETTFVYNLLVESNKDVQNEGWHFNTEYHVEFEPDSITKYISFPNNIIRYDVHNDNISRNVDLVRRDGRLYDLVDHTDKFEHKVDLDIVTLYKFEDVPPVFQRYIICKASSIAASQLVSNKELVALLKLKEDSARASVIEYECNQGDHSYMGFGYNNSYKPYQPYNALIR